MSFGSLSSPQRNPGIDLLRGLSVILVVLHHVGLRIPLKHGVLAAFLPQWLIHALIFNGFEAVFIFFVISGFLIASNTLARWGSFARIDAAAFYIRRASRILPCLVALVAVLSLLDLIGAKDYVITHSNQSLHRAIFSALGLHLNWYEGRTGYLPGGWDVLWSLSIEEVFYLGFPVVCLLLRWDGLLVPALGLLALSLPVTRGALAGNEIWQEKAYLPGMAGIATGILGAMISARYRPQNRRFLSALQILGAAGVLAVFFSERQLWRVMGNASLLILTVSATGLLLSFHWQPSQSWVRARGTAWLRAAGRLSYEIYLTHMFVVYLLVRAFKATGADLRWGALWYVPAVALTWLLGYGVAQYLSAPAERGMRSWLASTAQPWFVNLARPALPPRLEMEKIRQ